MSKSVVVVVEFRCPGTGNPVLAQVSYNPLVAGGDIRVGYCMACGKKHVVRAEDVEPIRFAEVGQGEASLAVPTRLDHARDVTPRSRHKGRSHR